MSESGIEPGASRTTVGCVTAEPPSQLKVSIVVKLFNRFNAMGRNINKQSQICGPHFFNKVHFSVIFYYVLITIFGSLREKDSLFKYGLKLRCKHFWSKDTGIASLKQSTNLKKLHLLKICVEQTLLT